MSTGLLFIGDVVMDKSITKISEDLEKIKIKLLSELSRYNGRFYVLESIFTIAANGGDSIVLDKLEMGYDLYSYLTDTIEKLGFRPVVLSEDAETITVKWEVKG